MSKKVAIVTLPGSFNYGNLLQKMAVQLAVRRRGLEPATLEFRDVSLARRAKDFVKLRLYGLACMPDLMLRPERRARFSSFVLGIEMREVNRAADVGAGGFDWFLCGSDQVWNPGYLDRFRSAFLPFSPPEKRIALSASFGVTELPGKYVNKYKGALSDFARISVREEAGADIVESLIGKRPSVLCDPTLAISRAEWELIANDSLNPSGSYIFAYLLGAADVWQNDLLHGIARKHGGASAPAEIVRISDRDDGSQLPAGPAEFVALIAEANHVVTDSFHCALFAAMFERPLTIVRRQGGGPSMFSRLETLSDKLGLWGKIVEQGTAIDFEAAASYDGLAGRIAAERAAFDAYLDEALGQRLHDNGPTSSRRRSWLRQHCG